MCHLGRYWADSRRWYCCTQEKKLEDIKAELDQTQSDLQLAFKRIADLQATIEDEVLRDSEEEFSDEDRLQPLTAINFAYTVLFNYGQINTEIAYYVLMCR